MKYNSKLKYNSWSTNFSAAYNSAAYRVMVNAYEVIECSETDFMTFARIVMSERNKAKDILLQMAFQENSDSVESADTSSYEALFNFVEKFSSSDAFGKIIVLLSINDRQDVLDKIAQAGTLVELLEKAGTLDAMDLSALIPVLQKAGFSEVADILIFLQEFEAAGFTDKDPRKEISDFLIGRVDSLDSAYDWIVPFNMKIDWKNTSIQVMPQSESSYIDISGVDGSIVEDTVYKNRLFSIVAFSELGLNIAEKEQLKRDIAQILDSTKNDTKKMVIQAADIAFDVKYSGAAEITSGPSYVKATIPLESTPYGYRPFDNIVYGIGLISNDGDKDAGCVHRISGGCVNPTFQLGKIHYKWDGTVPANSTLVIDHCNLTCYIETTQGNRTNAIDGLTGEFQIIPKHSSVSLTAPSGTANYISTELKEKILW